MRSLYEDYLLPRVTHLLCSSSSVMKQREKVIPGAFGNVLEIGVGSGLNLGFYDWDKVDHLHALDPSEKMLSLVDKNQSKFPQDIELVNGYSDDIPLENNVIDSVVITYTLCSIDRIIPSLEEFRRVLKPGGVLLFCEHGRAPDAIVRKWQDRLNPLWKTFGGGCNLNKDIPQLIQSGPFKIEKLETMYIPGFKPACFNYWGVARPR